MCQLAAAAYQHTTFENVTTDTQVCLFRNGDTIYVAFPGSKSAQDWLNNLKFGMTALAYGRHEAAQPCAEQVHRGFLSTYNSVRTGLLDRVAVMCAAGAAKIVLIGHSLGATLAKLAARDLLGAGRTVAAVYSFGCPRVGNAAFARHYNLLLGAVTYDFVCEGDPVPLVPTLLMRYRDTGMEIFLRRDGRVQINPWIGAELLTDALGLLQSWIRFRLGALPNHSLTTYLERMEKQS